MVKSEKNKRKIYKRRKLNSKVGQETFIHHTNANKMSQTMRIPEGKIQRSELDEHMI
jgi:hypothetical protein